MRRLVVTMACVLVLILAVGVAPSGATGAAPPGASSEEVNRLITPPGGMKSVQTGGNTVGDVIREARPRADGYRHIDTPATIRVLKQLGANTYTYLIWNSPTDWDDLVREFAPAAARAGIDIWLYLVPPSECQDNPVKHLDGRCSRPFKKDYVRWAEEIAKLSVAQPNVKVWALDDFFSQLSPEVVHEMQRVQDSINPNLGFYTTVYYGDAVNPHFYDRYEGLIDGIIYPYTGANSNTQDASKVGPNLDRILEQTEPRGLGVVLLAYTGRYLSAIVPPTDAYIADVITETRPYMEAGRLVGITLYGLPIAGGKQMSAYNVARTGEGWLSFAPSIFGRTEPGHFAQAEQRISVDPTARRHSLEFSDFDIYYDQNNTATQYHTRQVLIDGEVVWEAGAPASGGAWYRHYVDLTHALRGKQSATLTLRVTDKTSLSLWTGIVVDDVTATGFRVRNGGFEARGGWTLSTNNDVILPSQRHFADFDPVRQLDAAAAAFRGETYRQPDVDEIDYRRAPSDAMYGNGKLALTVEPFTNTPAGSCASASQVLTVDPASPRYEIDFFQSTPHAPYPGYAGAHQLTARIDGQPVWFRDANSIYTFWENGHSLQGPVDVSDFVTGKEKVTLSFQLCGLSHSSTQPNPAIEVGFDNLRTTGLQGANFGFEDNGGWTFTSNSPGLAAKIVPRSTRPDAPTIAAKAHPVVARPGTVAEVPVTVANSAATPISGEVTASVPPGWTLDPATTPFGPVPGGQSATVKVRVTVPETATEGTYWLVATATTPQTSTRAATRVQLIGNQIQFTPGTLAEAPWLSEPDGSQLDGPIFDGRGRFADGLTYFTYKFDLPPDVTGGTLTLHIGNEFVVKASENGTDWQEVLREPNPVHNLSNLADRTLNLTDLRTGNSPLYIRIEDAKPDDGWGGWLGRLTLTMTTN